MVCCGWGVGIGSLVGGVGPLVVVATLLVVGCRGWYVEEDGGVSRGIVGLVRGDEFASEADVKRAFQAKGADGRKSVREKGCRSASDSDEKK